MKRLAFRHYRRSPSQDPKDDTGDSKDKESAAYLKRREQVRRAQRTHRERKENYIKTLEDEVLQLRTNEARMLQENRYFQQETKRLEQILDQHGIPHVASLDVFASNPVFDNPEDGSSSSIAILENPLHQQQIHVGPSGDFYLAGSEEGPITESRDALQQKRSWFRRRDRSRGGSNEDIESSASSHKPAIDTSTTTQPSSNTKVRDMDHTQIGMEFVLALEANCLHHIQGESSDIYAPTGHALTASAPLLYQSPIQPVDTHAVTTSSPTQDNQWQTTHIGLEKLLSLSSNFDLTDELTPVQAWHQIRTHSAFGNLELEGLKGLTQDLLKHVKCYGFGAVIEETFLRDKLEEVLLH